jgi:hypothetical protein
MTVLARVALPINPRYETRYDIGSSPTRASMAFLEDTCIVTRSAEEHESDR